MHLEPYQIYMVELFSKNNQIFTVLNSFSMSQSVFKVFPKEPVKIVALRLNLT